MYPLAILITSSKETRRGCASLCGPGYKAALAVKGSGCKLKY